MRRGDVRPYMRRVDVRHIDMRHEHLGSIDFDSIDDGGKRGGSRHRGKGYGCCQRFHAITPSAAVCRRAVLLGPILRAERHGGPQAAYYCFPTGTSCPLTHFIILPLKASASNFGVFLSIFIVLPSMVTVGGSLLVL